MTDIITNNIPDEQSGYEYSGYRINQIQPVGSRCIKVFSKEFLNVLYEEFQDKSSQSSKDTYQETKYEYELLIGDMLFSPLYKTLQKRKFFLSFS